MDLYPPEPTAELPPPPLLPPPRRRRRWPWVVGALTVLVVLAVVLAGSIKVSYYAVSPGPVELVADFISVEDDSPTFASSGDLYFLTVLLDEVTVLQYIDAAFDDRVDLQPRESIRPSGVSQDEMNAVNRAQMEESKERAIFVALTQLGYEATLTGRGAMVMGVVDDSPAVGVLEEGDVIVAIDGDPVSFASEAVALVGRTGPGDRITLTIERPGSDDQEPDPFTVDLELGTNPEDETRGFIGVFLDTRDLQTEFPVHIDIDSRNIGGPSAGMMYTLQIMDLLTEEDLTKGHRIAGTGTIEFDGDVGPIGGIRQKVYAAIDAGAEYVLVPSENVEDARSAAGDDIEVVSIDTFADVLDFLDGLVPAEAVVASP